MTTLKTLVYEAPDLPGQWIGHCLDLDIISQAPNPVEAVEMLAESIELLAADNVAAGQPALLPRPIRDPDSLLHLQRLCRETAFATRGLRMPPAAFAEPVGLVAHLAQAR